MPSDRRKPLEGRRVLSAFAGAPTSAVAVKPPELGWGDVAAVSFSVAGNTSRRVVLKLGRPAATILRKKHKLSRVLTVTIVRPGATPSATRSRSTS